MEANRNLKYEQQKEDILQIAEETMGKAYFEKLEEILLKIEENSEDENYFKYSLTYNNKGAFYASEK